MLLTTLKLSRKQFSFLVKLISVLLFETDFNFMFFTLVLFGNSPDQLSAK